MLGALIVPQLPLCCEVQTIGRLYTKSSAQNHGNSQFEVQIPQYVGTVHGEEHYQHSCANPEISSETKCIMDVESASLYQG